VAGRPGIGGRVESKRLCDAAAAVEMAFDELSQCWLKKETCMESQRLKFTWAGLPPCTFILQ